MGVGPAGHDVEAVGFERLGERLGIFHDVLAYSLNDGRSASPNATALAAMTCISGPPCWPGKTAELIFRQFLVVAEHEAAARAAQGLVRRRT